MSTIALKTNKKKLKNDHYQTPWYAIEPLLAYIPKDRIIWDCACGDGQITSFFLKHGYLIVGSDILHWPDEDFFRDDVIQRRFHSLDDVVIVTNPPFSLKTEFLERASQIGTPFAFLMNITSLETQCRQSVFQKAGMQLLLPNKRISYIVDGIQTKSSWFYSAWFLFGFNLEHDINYVEIRP